MKKLLIALTAGTLALVATAASADAGHYVKYVVGYDRCGNAIYSQRYVPSRSYHRSNSYCQPSYSRSHHYNHSSYRHYSRPSYSYSRSYSRSYGRGYCR